MRVKRSRLAKDSFWAVFGNGTGNALLLFAGIIIARMLGKDLYGEYGLVKTTMFQIAAFSTFGLGYTSTKFIAEYVAKDQSMLRSITMATLSISTVSSFVLCALLFVFSHRLADFINAPQLSLAFRVLGLIIVCRALSTTGNGLLAGYKRFKIIGINAIISGVVMISACIPLTYYWGVRGSLLSLLASQLVLCILDVVNLVNISRHLANQQQMSFTKQLITFSFPVAMKEFTYMLQAWGTSLMLTKYASLGEVGLYTAGTQWLAIVMFMPGLLGNVVLSYLSGEVGKDNQKRMMRRMILVNFACAFVPFLIVCCLSGFIVDWLYGPTFKGLQIVLNVCVCQCIFLCVTNVLSSELIARGHNWLQFIILSSRDLLIIISVYLTLTLTHGVNGALNLSVVQLCISALNMLVLLAVYKTQVERKM